MDVERVKEMDWSRGDEGDYDDSSSVDGSFADDDEDDADVLVNVESGDKKEESSSPKKKKKKSKTKDKDNKEKKKDKKKAASKKSKDKDKKKTKDKKKKAVVEEEGSPDEDDGEIVPVEKDKKKKDKKKKSKDKAVEKPSKEKKEKKGDKPDKTKKAEKEEKKKEEKKEKKEKSKKKSSKKSKSVEDSPVDEDDSDRVEDPEAEKMKQLLAAWDDDNSSSDSSDSSDDDDEDDNGEEKTTEVKRLTKRELGLNDNEIDHIILAAPDFFEALKEFETMTGIKPAQCGTLKGLGIKAARVAMDNNCYIEILAPDPKSAGPIGSVLAELEEGSLVPFHFAVRASELDELQEDFVPNELGYVPDRINLFGSTPDGLPAKWGMLFMHGHFLGGVVPFYVDWGDCGHPLSSIPQVGALKGLIVTAPGGSQVHDLLKKVDFVTTQEGEPALEFAVGSPEGTITFSSDKPLGLVFPGAGGDAGAPAPVKPDLLPLADREDEIDDDNDGDDEDDDNSISHAIDDDDDGEDGDNNDNDDDDYNNLNDDDDDDCNDLNNDDDDKEVEEDQDADDDDKEVEEDQDADDEDREVEEDQDADEGAEGELNDNESLEDDEEVIADDDDQYSEEEDLKY